MMYRCAWVAPTGTSGHGDWTDDRTLAQAAVEYGNREWPDIKHWIEEKETPSPPTQKEPPHARHINRIAVLGIRQKAPISRLCEGALRREVCARRRCLGLHRANEAKPHMRPTLRSAQHTTTARHVRRGNSFQK